MNSCVKAPELTLTGSPTLQLSENGSSGTLSFTANRDWTITSSESWVTVSPSSGKAADGPVTVTVVGLANTTYEDRTATLTIRADELTQTVTVRQPANLGVVLPSRAYNLVSDARTLEVEVQANVAYSVSVSETWIKQTGTKGLTTDKLIFIVEENTSYDARSATITITPQQAGVAEQVIQVTQAQKGVMIIDKTSYDMPSGGGEIEVKVDANVSFDVTPDCDWIHYVSTKALSSSTIRLSVDKNLTSDVRKGTVLIKEKDGSLSYTLTVRQKAYVAVVSVELDQTELTLGMEDTAILTAVVKPDDATDKTVTWTSDNPEIAGVQNGKVTGVKIGETTITAKAGDREARCRVKVVNSQELERAALVAFYKANNGDNWIENDGWCTDRPLNEWVGVSLTSDGRHVSSLNLQQNNVVGYIPKEIGDLSALTILNISNSDADNAKCTNYGPLPEELGKLKQLRTLSLGYPLSGTLPQSLFNLTSLRTLVISHPLWMEKQSIPAAIKNLKNLRTLSLSGMLSGNLPSEIGDLRELNNLTLASNNLTGSIPESFGSLINLEHVNLDGNQLSGRLPESLQRLELYWQIWPGLVIGSKFSQDDIRAGRIPAPRSPVITTLSGGMLDLEQLYSECDYTVLYKAYPEDFPEENIKKLINLKKAHPGLAVVTYFENHPEWPNSQGLDEEFKSVLARTGADWESFIFNMTKDYSSEGGAPFYTQRYYDIFPVGNPSEVTVIGPEKTVVYTTVLNTLSGNKFDDMIAFLEKELGSPLQHYESADYSADGAVKTLQKASTGAGVDLVITGDAFSDRLIADGSFEKLARNAVENFFSAEPLKSLRDRFNVYLVNAVSENEEYFNGCSTVFSGSFGYATATGGDNDKVLEYVRKAVPDSRMDNALVLVMMNSSRRAGTCYMLDAEDPTVYAGGASVSWVPYNDASVKYGSSANVYTLIHELGGHGLGKLADEYYYLGQGEIPAAVKNATKKLQEKNWYVNVDFTSDVAEVRWSRFVDDGRYAEEALGAYVGALGYYLGVWRPTDNSIMFQSNSPDVVFNAPSRAQIYTRIMKLSEGESWSFDYETFVQWDLEHPNEVPAHRDARKLHVPVNEEEPVHTPPVITGRTWRKMTGAPQK